MQISMRDLYCLLDSLRGSLTISDNGELFSVDRKSRVELYNRIVNSMDSIKLSVMDDLPRVNPDAQCTNPDAQ